MKIHERTQILYQLGQKEPLLKASVDRVPKQYVFDKNYNIQMFEESNKGEKSASSLTDPKQLQIQVLGYSLSTSILRSRNHLLTATWCSRQRMGISHANLIIGSKSIGKKITPSIAEITR